MAKNRDQADALRNERRMHAQHLKDNPLFKKFYTDREQAILAELYLTKVNWFTRRKRDALLLEYQTVRGMREDVEVQART